MYFTNLYTLSLNRSERDEEFAWKRTQNLINMQILILLATIQLYEAYSKNGNQYPLEN